MIARRSKVEQQVRIVYVSSTNALTPVSGKQLVYHCIQTPPSYDETPSDLALLDTQATALREGIAEAKATEKTLKSEITLLSAVTSSEDLKSTIEALLSQKAVLEDRLVELNKVNVTPVSEAEKIQLESEQAKWNKLRNQRKKIFKMLWQQYVDIKIDATEDRIKETDLWEEVGCDGEMPK
jgi:hypothetical protein